MTLAKKRATLVLSYAGCSTCTRALKWLAAHQVPATVRAIVDEPPTKSELGAWLPRSGLPVRKWLNTSGQSYRSAGGKAHFDGLTDAQIVAALAADGKLVKRPVLVDGETVLVGFDEERWSEALGVG
jgi:arsenate reductase